MGLYYTFGLSLHDPCVLLLLLAVVAQNRFDDYYGLITSKLNLNSLF